jgi:hypothetical protein
MVRWFANFLLFIFIELIRSNFSITIDLLNLNGFLKYFTLKKKNNYNLYLHKYIINNITYIFLINLVMNVEIFN